MLIEGQKGVQSKSKGAKKCTRRARPSYMEEESDTEGEAEKKSVKSRQTLPQSSDDDSDFDIPAQRTYIQFQAASGLEVIL